MASDNNNSDSRVNLYPILLALLLTTGVLIDPLTSSRPNDPEQIKPMSTSHRNIEVRLWQDPIAAIERYIKSKSSAEPEVPHPGIDSLKNEMPKNAAVKIVAVSVSGDSFYEALEIHRRSRFAVVSALGYYGYNPRDSGTINYFQYNPPKYVESGWPLVLGPMSRIQSNPNEIVNVPYEWFDNDKQESTLVLWLNEHKITKDKYRDFIHSLYTELKTLSRAERKVSFQLMGPAGTSLLVELMKRDPIKFLDKDFQIISSSATISNPDLIKELKRDCSIHDQKNWYCSKDAERELENEIKKRSIIRSIGTDNNLANALLWELRQRGINRIPTFVKNFLQGFPKHQCKDGLVLIGEQDSLYARTLSQHLKDGFLKLCATNSEEKESPSLVRVFTYLRGLDGKLSGIDESDDKEKNKNDKKDSKNFLTQLDDAPPEHAEGRNQIDYLRRLSNTIEQLDLDKGFAENGIRAIGIIGTDVYDKLLILQALRNRFNDKIFFATDLDARFLHADQIKWTRNLVVASNYDLTLHPKLQDSAMPFRDSYQTSMYFAILLAFKMPSIGQLNEWLKPQIFEIGRTQAVHLASPDKDDLEKWIKNKGIIEIGNNATKSTILEKDQCSKEKWVSCTTIEPDRSSQNILSSISKHITDDNWVELLKKLGFILLSFFLALLVCHRIIMKAFCAMYKLWISSEAITKAIGCCLWLAAIPFFIYCVYKDNFPSHFIGEPFLWMEGISVWPNLVIRFSGILLIIALICISYHRMWVEAIRINDKYFRLKSEKQAINYTPVFRIAAVLEGPHSDMALRSSNNPNKSFDKNQMISIKHLWENYLYTIRCPEMCVWIFITMLTAFLLTLYVFFYFEPLSFSYRGNITFYMHYTFKIIQFLMLWGLIFWVGYEWSACRSFINNLYDARPTWSNKLRKDTEKETGVSSGCLDYYIRFRLIVNVTKRIIWLVYLPFLLIFIIVLGRSTIFDALGLPITLIVTFVFAVAYLAYVMFRLRQCAENFRDKVLTYYEAQQFQQTLSDKDESNDEKRIDRLIESIRHTREGIFASFSDQPVLHAILLPAGGIGGIQIIEYLFSK